MAVLSLPSTVTPAAGAIQRPGIAGATMAAGEAVYYNVTTGRFDVATANNAAASVAEVVGICLNGAAAGQPINIIVDGFLNGCTGLKPGKHYLLSNVLGDLAEGDADLTEDTSYSTYIGYAFSATILRVKPLATGIKINLV